jgi:hypothetical protein
MNGERVGKFHCVIEEKFRALTPAERIKVLDSEKAMSALIESAIEGAKVTRIEIVNLAPGVGMVWQPAREFMRETTVAPNTPPKLAEFMLVLLAKSAQREAALGDLNELFEADCAKLGCSRAARIYWARALRSAWPLLRRAISRALRWATVVALLKRLI